MAQTYPAQTDSTPVWAAVLLYLTAAMLAMLGLAMLAGGIALARLGGSLYYLIAGAGIVVSAVLIVMRHHSGVLLYWTVIGGSIVWAVWEVGFNLWLLLPRLLVLMLLGMWLLLPWNQAPLRGRIGGRASALTIITGVIVASLAGP